MLEGHVHHNLAVAQLSVSGKQGQLHVLDCAELGVLFVVGVHKMLNLTHLELSDAQQPGPRCDLIAEAQTQLSGGEGHLASVELEQPPEVDEDALGCLGPQVAHQVPLGPDGRLEHEVEGEGRRESVAVGRLDAQIQEGLVHFLTAECVRLHLELLQPVVLVWGQAGLLLGLNLFLEDLVGPVALARDGVLDHQVGEAVDVAGGLEDHLGRQASARHLKHVLVQHKVPPPQRLHLSLERTPRRTEVK
mmetsp:Transcript_13061/g.31206  ORF Transcript_13061/g.31206 Transcript_13061/m.31206 type:complete len:247 (+) Transcript_13061:816-1556(+)